jgi:NADH-quinone oxidoreductase subunit N
VLIQDGGWWWALVAVIGVNTVLSLYYYVRVVKVMYLEDNDAPGFSAHPLGTAVSVVCAAVLVLMFIGSNPLTKLTTKYSDLHPAAARGAGQGQTPTAMVK